VRFGELLCIVKRKPQLPGRAMRAVKVAREVLKRAIVIGVGEICCQEERHKVAPVYVPFAAIVEDPRSSRVCEGRGFESSRAEGENTRRAGE